MFCINCYICSVVCIGRGTEGDEGEHVHFWLRFSGIYSLAVPCDHQSLWTTALWVNLWCNVVIKIQFTLYRWPTFSPFRLNLAKSCWRTLNARPRSTSALCRFGRSPHLCHYSTFIQRRSIFFLLTSPRLSWKYDLFDSTTDNLSNSL